MAFFFLDLPQGQPVFPSFQCLWAGGACRIQTGSLGSSPTPPPTLVLVLCWSLLTLWNEQGAVPSKIPHLTECLCCSAEQPVHTIKHGQHQCIKLTRKDSFDKDPALSKSDRPSLSYTIQFWNVILVLESGSRKLAAFDVTGFKDLRIILSVRGEFLPAQPIHIS